MRRRPSRWSSRSTPPRPASRLLWPAEPAGSLPPARPVPVEKQIDPFLAACGEVIAADALEIAKARSVAWLLQARDDVGAGLVEARKSADTEWLITSVAVDVGQVP